MNMKDLIREYISDVTLLIQKLHKFQNENTFKVYGGNGFCLEVATFMKRGLRYEYRYHQLMDDGTNVSEYFPKKIRYKSINKFLHDLKIYRNELQRYYSLCCKYEK